MRHLIFTCLLTLLLAPVTHAKNTTPATAPTTKESMAEFLDQFLILKKYIISDAEFKDPKNEAEISKALNALAKAVKKTTHDPMLNQENFKFSRAVLEDHVVEAERVFRLGNKFYARWMTNSTLGICMSCHTQTSTSERPFNILLKTKYFTSDFDQAEFMFATKNFKGADIIYHQLAMQYPKSNISESKLETAIHRELIYKVRIKRDLKAAEKDIDDLLKNKNLPNRITENLNRWKKEIAQWKTRSLPDITKMSAEEVSKAFSTAEDQYISDLILSGVMYDWLQTHPESKPTPEVLYRLAVIDRRLSNTFFYSLANLYLKECMLKFPESPTAMKCYKEYEDEMIFGYSGSSGTHLPPEVQTELRQLKQFVETKGKIEYKKGLQ